MNSKMVIPYAYTTNAHTTIFFVSTNILLHVQIKLHVGLFLSLCVSLYVCQYDLLYMYVCIFHMCVRMYFVLSKPPSLMCLPRVERVT